jgi:NADH-quinone oxidoreductase subunit M
MGKTMPIFATFAGVFALSSLAFPGTNSFIGEFLVMAGGFKVSTAMMVCVVPGVILAAAYMLRMLQRVAYGGTRNPDHSHLKDLGLREIVTLTPLLVFVFWIGLNPEPFTRVLDASVKHLVEQAEPAASAVAIKPEGQNKTEGKTKAELRKPQSGSLGAMPPQVQRRNLS